MPEAVADALVLGFAPVRDRDAVADLFLRDRGRVRARVIGGRRPLSKFAPHLDPVSLVTVRLVSKRSVTVTDVIVNDRFPLLRSRGRAFHTALELIHLVREIIPGQAPDRALFEYLVESFSHATPSVSLFLTHLGYDPRHATCDSCRSTEVDWFAPEHQRFFCAPCAVKANTDAVSWVQTRSLSASRRDQL